MNLVLFTLGSGQIRELLWDAIFCHLLYVQ